MTSSSTYLLQGILYKFLSIFSCYLILRSSTWMNTLEVNKNSWLLPKAGLLVVTMFCDVSLDDPGATCFFCYSSCSTPSSTMVALTNSLKISLVLRTNELETSCLVLPGNNILFNGWNWTWLDRTILLFGFSAYGPCNMLMYDNNIN
jgi:hypothetical protein